MKYLAAVTVLLTALGACTTGGLTAKKLDKLEYNRTPGTLGRVEPPIGHQLIAIKFAPAIEKERKFVTSEVMLEDDTGAKFNLIGAAPKDQMEQFRDFTRPIDNDRAVLSAGADGVVTSSEVGLLQGSEPAFKLKGKDAYVTLVFAVPAGRRDLKLKVVGYPDQPISVQ